MRFYIKRGFACLFIFSLMNGVKAQNGNKQIGDYVLLNVGDKVPDFTLNNLINYPSTIAKLSDFGRKLLILDFWSTGCKACILSWPKLLDLQKKFGDKIQIVLINPWQNKTIVLKALEARNKITKVNMTLPCAYGDSSILNLFSVPAIPQIVWIDSAGFVKSITNGDLLNSKNISAILKGEEVDMPQLIGDNEVINPDFSKPLFVNGNGLYAKDFFYYSFLGKGDDYLRPYCGIEVREKNGYSTLTNHSIEDFYRMAYSNRMLIPQPGVYNSYLIPLSLNRIVLNVKDTSNYVEYIGGEKNRKNRDIYQLIAPAPVTAQKLQTMMQADLKRYINLEVHLAKMRKKWLGFACLDTSLISFKKV